MTDEQIRTLKDDIAFMRAMAQEGSTVPLLFGGNLVAAGVIFGLAAVVHWLIAAEYLRVSPWAYMVTWLTAAAVFGVVCTLLVRRARSQPGFNAAVNKATSAAWAGVGMAIFVMWLGLMAYASRSGVWDVLNVFPVIIFALYGAAWMVVGAMSGKLWIKAVAWLSFVAAVGMGLVTGTSWLMLGYAACLMVLAVAPGVYLIRQEPSDVV